jgi:curved DNA-binding protein CbpA
MKKLLLLLCLIASQNLKSMEHPKDESLYKILGVEINASKEIIKQAFSNLARQFHPDRCTPESHEIAQAKEKFEKITEAHEILRNPETRHIYDQEGLAAVQNFLEMQQYEQTTLNDLERISSVNDENTKNMLKEKMINNCSSLIANLYLNILNKNFSQVCTSAPEKAVLYIERLSNLDILTQRHRLFEKFQALKNWFSNLRGFASKQNVDQSQNNNAATFVSSSKQATKLNLFKRKRASDSSSNKQKKSDKKQKVSINSTDVVNELNKQVSEYLNLNSQTAQKDNPSKFCNTIIEFYKNIERYIPHQSNDYFTLEHGILKNYYLAALHLYNNYPISLENIDGVKYCNTLCITALNIPFRIPAVQVMPSLSKLCDKTIEIIQWYSINHDAYMSDKKTVSEFKAKSEFRYIGEEIHWNTLAEVQSYLIETYAKIERFEGPHQNIALQHYYKVAKDLFKSNNISLALETIDRALLKKWQSQADQEISKIKELQKTILEKMTLDLARDETDLDISFLTKDLPSDVLDILGFKK